MTKDEIYDHLAQIYLGKHKKVDEKKDQQKSVWLLINILITVVIFASAFYGLTAFLTQKNSTLKNSIIYSLHNGPLRVEYNFTEPFPPVKKFSLSVAPMDAGKYTNLSFAIRGKEEGIPGVIKIVVRNDLNEEASYYIHDIDFAWKTIEIPLEEFKQITDWTSLKDITFVLESWNVERQKGIILIDDVVFSS